MGSIISLVAVMALDAAGARAQITAESHANGTFDVTLKPQPGS